MIDEPFVTGETRLPAWPIAWSPVWVGALCALAVGLVIGLIGYAVGAHQLSASGGIDWRSVPRISVVFSIAGAFLSFVVGGWVSARMAGFRRADTAILHGAIAWLVTVPFFMLLGALGTGGYLGGWYGGLAQGVGPVDPAVAAAFRNTAVATASALLLGLVGSVLGGWMASGEPMTLAYYRRRRREGAFDRPRRAA
jgi:hypothetical protein